MRLVRFFPLLVLALSVVASPAPAGATPAPAASAAAAPQAVQQPAAGGLPARPAPPRTLRDHWHVFVAFALAWVLLFGYVVSLGRRFARVERDLQRLGGA